MNVSCPSASQRTSPFLFLVIGAGVVATLTYTAMALSPKSKERSSKIEVIFSPGGGCESRIVEEIGAARRQIRVQMYMFSSRRIGDALGQAAKRGVNVEVILDKSQEKATYGPWRLMRNNGVKVYFDDEHGTANNKITLIDDRTVITGSYNFTKAAEEKNAENILIVKDHQAIIEAYRENFETHLAHARRAAG